METKKRMLSGIQPTGTFTLGNYIGAINNWNALQDEFECFYFIANLHSLTTSKDPLKLKNDTLDAIALLLACGIDPKKSVIFLQSDISAHTKLNWVLDCFTQYGELSRMTQFKDKSKKNPQNINAGLFCYPVLMAADILLYKPDFVPIGADQKQHLELARNIAIRFNGLFENTFKVPQPYIKEYGAKIMSLSDPTSKMSKSSDNKNSFISVLDDEDVIIKKFKRAVTDSNSSISYENGGDGIKNLITIYRSITKKSICDIENEFKNLGYGDFKLAVANAVSLELKPIRDNFSKFRNDENYLKNVLKDGAIKASAIANQTLEDIYKKVGIL